MFVFGSSLLFSKAKERKGWDNAPRTEETLNNNDEIVEPEENQESALSSQKSSSGSQKQRGNVFNFSQSSEEEPVDDEIEEVPWDIVVIKKDKEQERKWMEEMKVVENWMNETEMVNEWTSEIERNAQMIEETPKTKGKSQESRMEEERAPENQYGIMDEEAWKKKAEIWKKEAEIVENWMQGTEKIDDWMKEAEKSTEIEEKLKNKEKKLNNSSEGEKKRSEVGSQEGRKEERRPKETEMIEGGVQRSQKAQNDFEEWPPEEMVFESFQADGITHGNHGRNENPIENEMECIYDSTEMAFLDEKINSFFINNQEAIKEIIGNKSKKPSGCPSGKSTKKLERNSSKGPSPSFEENQQNEATQGDKRILCQNQNEENLQMNTSAHSSIAKSSQNQPAFIKQLHASSIPSSFSIDPRPFLEPKTLMMTSKPSPLDSKTTMVPENNSVSTEFQKARVGSQSPNPKPSPTKSDKMKKEDSLRFPNQKSSQPVPCSSWEKTQGQNKTRGGLNEQEESQNIQIQPFHFNEAQNQMEIHSQNQKSKENQRGSHQFNPKTDIWRELSSTGVHSFEPSNEGIGSTMSVLESETRFSDDEDGPSTGIDGLQNESFNEFLGTINDVELNF